MHTEPLKLPDTEFWLGTVLADLEGRGLETNEIISVALTLTSAL